MYYAPRNGRTKHPLYHIWSGIKNRCFNPNEPAWVNYGGRGITVCDRWRTSFDNFLADMGERPTPKHTIERKNNHGHYEPGNCVWATRTEQGFNKRNNRVLEIDGKQMTMLKASAIYGLSTKFMHGRASNGYTDRQIVGLDPLPGPLFGHTPAKEAYWAKRRKKWDARTVCPNGHPWTKENELWEKNGTRKCRQCHNERRRSDGSYFKALREATHCRHGHEFTPDNIRIVKGIRLCVICLRESSKQSQRRARAKQREITHASPPKLLRGL